MKSQFSITFKLESDAFQDDNQEHEIIRILNIIRTRVQAQFKSGVIHDINGNNIGEWLIKGDEK